MGVDTSETLAQRAEMLAVRKRAGGTGMGTRDPENYIATLSVQECIDADQLIHDALAANERLERERDEARASVATCQAFVAARGTNRDYQEARAVKAEAERDAANAARLAAEGEIADLKLSVIAFAAPHAVCWSAERGFPPGHLHPTHYDILAKAGARMDSFTRATLTPAPEAPKDGE